jgi:S-DNA-T family DNA segregation ATPase FtsK/SpoIIIE
LKVKLSLLSPGGEQRDIIVTVDATATIGEVARHLSEADPLRAGAIVALNDITLRICEPDAPQHSQLNPLLTVHESELRSGCSVEIVAASARHANDQALGPTVATATIHSGLDAGKTFALGSGVNYVGRIASAQVLLTDPGSSRRHASITVAESISITDLNSANGVEIDGAMVARAILSPSSRVKLADTVFSVAPVSNPVPSVASLTTGTTGFSAPQFLPTAGAVPPFSRSPRVEPSYRGGVTPAPELPGPIEKTRFPVLAVVAPIVMGFVLFALTQQVMSLIFVALSPLIMLGTWVDNRTQNKRKLRDTAERFATSLAALRVALAKEREREVAARTSESPSISQVCAAVQGRLPLLWTRKPEHSTFLEVRFGTGTLPSRNTVTAPALNSALPRDWALAQQLVADFSGVDVVPVVENLDRAGSIGIAGQAAVASDAARALVAQLAGLHSPAELVITAFGAGESSAEWAWLTWLPHVDSPYSPLKAGGLAADFGSAAALLAELEELVATRILSGLGTGGQVRSRLDEATRLDAGHGLAVERLPAIPAIIVLVTAGAPADRARLVALAAEGANAGVHIIWLAASLEQLPVVCRTYLEIDANGQSGRVGFVRLGHSVELVGIERLDSLSALRLAKLLAPIEDSGAQVLDESDLPHSVRFLDLFDSPIADNVDAIVQRWHKNGSLTAEWMPGVAREPGGIRALVGQGAAEPFYLDLRRHGPHALVGGTTGSGKSEFLQTWIMAMATEYSPDRLTFLLIDYKGGAAFAECVGLPHTVGLVTDLNTHLVRRALTSLRAELKYREHLLNSKGAKDLEALEKRSDPEAPPVLVIVIDEFAALATEVPEFVDGVIDVAQRGRSLGLHLVMATQRPAGVIKDSLRANTNLRVALRMSDVADSQDVVGVASAALFDPGTPGRAAAKLGPGRVLDFQAAYLGGNASGGRATDIEVAELRFGVGAGWIVPQIGGDARISTGVGADTPPAGRDIERLAHTISGAATLRSLALPRKPWLDPLPELINLFSLGQVGDFSLVLGVEDCPGEQRQRPFEVNLDLEGNVAIFGTGGSGKSAILRTFALAASRNAASSPVNIHALDFAGGGLAGLADLPTVGSIVSGDDAERVSRLIKDLAATLAERTIRYSGASASTLTEYRALTGKTSEPRILILIDGMAALRNDYEYRNAGAVFGELTKLISTGRQVGIHFVIAADRLAAFPSALLASVQRTIVLRLAGATEYAIHGVAEDALTDMPAGRGLTGSGAGATRREVQFAVAGGSSELAAQMDATRQFCGELVTAGVTPTQEVERLSEFIERSTLPVDVNGAPTLGVSDETLEAVGVPLYGLFVVTGPFGSGRTTTMRTIVRGIAAVRPDLKRYLIVARRSDLAAVTGWAGSAHDAEAAGELARSLAEELESPIAERDGARVIVIENVGDFEGLAAEASVARLIKAARRAGVTVIVESDTVTAASAWQIFAELKTARAGIALQPEEGDGGSLFRVQFPRGTRADYPVGRGILVSAGQMSRVQVAYPD